MLNTHQSMRLFKKIDPLQREKWEQLHKKGYHPSVKEALKLIDYYPEGKGWIFEDWGRRLQMDDLANVKNKIVLEIGFGGGWYIAQILKHGANKAIGFEVSRTTIDKTKELLDILHLTNYDLHEVDERYLEVLPPNSVDIGFEHTVFQHITEEATRNYLKTLSSVLKQDGFFIGQFLMNDKIKIKDPYAKGEEEGIIYYSHDEVLNMVKDCGYIVTKYADHEWTDKNGSYWRYYVLKPV